MEELEEFLDQVQFVLVEVTAVETLKKCVNALPTPFEKPCLKRTHEENSDVNFVLVYTMLETFNGKA